MNARRTCARFGAMGLLAGTMTLVGCGFECSLVSRDEFLKNAYGNATRPVEDGTVVHTEGGERPRVIVIPGETSPSLPPRTASADGASVAVPSGVVSAARAPSAAQLGYLASVNGEVAAMETRMLEIASRAEVKGAAAQAALDPHQRAFNASVDAIEAKIDDPADVPAEDWATLEADVNEWLNQARQEVEAAARDVDATPSP